MYKLLEKRDIVDVCVLLSNVANEVALAEVDTLKLIITNPKYFRSDEAIKLFNKLKSVQLQYQKFLNTKQFSEEAQYLVADFNEVYDDYLPLYVQEVRKHVEQAYYKAKIPQAKVISAVQIMDFMCQFACFTNEKLKEMFSHTPGINNLDDFHLKPLMNIARRLLDFTFSVKSDCIPFKWNIMSHKGVEKAKDNLFKALLDEKHFLLGWDIITKTKNHE